MFHLAPPPPPSPPKRSAKFICQRHLPAHHGARAPSPFHSHFDVFSRTVLHPRRVFLPPPLHPLGCSPLTQHRGSDETSAALSHREPIGPPPPPPPPTTTHTHSAPSRSARLKVTSDKCGAIHWKTLYLILCRFVDKSVRPYWCVLRYPCSGHMLAVVYCIVFCTTNVCAPVGPAQVPRPHGG